MKKGFFRNYNNTLTHLLPLYEQVDNLLLADFLLTWNDLVSPNKENVLLAQKHNVPAIIIEHGMKAVADYEKGLEDIAFKMGGKPFISDHIMTWGDKSRDIMLEAGLDESKVTTVGSPVIRDYFYRYQSEEGMKTVPFNAGDLIIDPTTKTEWHLLDATMEIPRMRRDKDGNPLGKLILFMPYHDWTENGRKQTAAIYEKIKDIPNLLVAASSVYNNQDKDNPFLELMKIEPYSERIKKILCSDIRKPTNIDLIKRLFERATLVITAIPGTVNGIAWAMDVPTLVPRIDWHWRREGNVVYDIHPADYSCELDNLVPTIESILAKDTKTDERLEYAKYFMGIDKGNPVENMRKVIEEMT